jgi:hypothetical protein
MFEERFRVGGSGKQDLEYRKARRSRQTSQDNCIHSNPQPLEKHPAQNAKDRNPAYRVQFLVA